MSSGISLLVFPSEHVHLLEIFEAIPKISSASGDYYLTGRDKGTHSLGSYVKKAVIPKNTVSCNSRCFWFSRRLVSFLESSEQISRFGAAFKKPPPKRRFLVHQQGLEPGTR